MKLAVLGIHFMIDSQTFALCSFQVKRSRLRRVSTSPTHHMMEDFAGSQTPFALVRRFRHSKEGLQYWCSIALRWLVISSHDSLGTHCLRQCSNSSLQLLQLLRRSHCGRYLLEQLIRSTYATIHNSSRQRCKARSLLTTTQCCGQVPTSSDAWDPTHSVFCQHQCD